MKHIENIHSKHQEGLISDLADSSNLSALTEGLDYEIGDFIKLELTAEEMLQKEAMLVRDYLTNNTRHFWSDLKGELLYWELTLGAVMLKAADPLSADWQFNNKNYPK